MSTKSMDFMSSRIVRLASSTAVMWAVISAMGGRAGGWPRYDDGCSTCHSFFASPYQPAGGGSAWPSSLHAVHADGAYMAADCDLCHRTGDGGNPYVAWSDGVGQAPPVGCLGCHGQGDGVPPRFSGLLRAHLGTGAGCESCHALSGFPPPFPEHEPPVYYGLAASEVAEPCNGDAATSEDWSGDGVGLDNDGDGLFDMDDPDCGAQVCGDGAVQIGEVCDGTDMGGNDCTTIGGGFVGGELGCGSDCQTFDTSGCKTLPECGDGVVEGAEVCDGTDLDGNDCTTIGEGFTGGTLGCLADCTGWDTSGCVTETECGNGVVEQGETCDPPSSCPTECSSDDPCVRATLQGSAASCDATCVFEPIAECGPKDGCCPEGCAASGDPDCRDGGGCGCRSASPFSFGGLGLLFVIILMLAAAGWVVARSRA